MRPRLVIMVKEPRAGRVKSRLARDVGVINATCFFRQNMAATIARLGRDPRWQTLIAVAPDTAIASPMFPHHVARLAQGQGDLGQRLTRVARNAPCGPLIIIGTDIPDIHANSIAGAFRTLGANDAVLGPSSDGGYWLVGLNMCTRAARAFDNVRWSSPFARSDTAANLKSFSVASIEAKDDIDNGSDLKRLGAHAGRLVLTRR